MTIMHEQKDIRSRLNERNRLSWSSRRSRCDILHQVCRRGNRRVILNEPNPRHVKYRSGDECIFAFAHVLKAFESYSHHVHLVARRVLWCQPRGNPLADGLVQESVICPRDIRVWLEVDPDKFWLRLTSPQTVRHLCNGCDQQLQSSLAFSCIGLIWNCILLDSVGRQVSVGVSQRLMRYSGSALVSVISMASISCRVI